MTTENKTTGQKIQAAGPWAALIGVLPALVLAWQSKDTADSAKSQAKSQAADVQE